MDNKFTIVTAGDGFAAGHIHPMWPQLLQMLVKNCRVINLGKPAAGNEYIFNAVLNTLDRITGVDLVLVQWAQCQRLDLILDTEFKDIVANRDPVYHFNQYIMGHYKWWLSNASQQEYVQRYHQKYIGFSQALLRTENYQRSLGTILNSQGIPYRFFSTYDIEGQISSPVYQNYPWIWHIPGRGMEHYSKRPTFELTRGTEVQPSTEVHFNWILDVLEPALQIDWDYERIDQLKQKYQNDKTT